HAPVRPAIAPVTSTSFCSSASSSLTRVTRTVPLVCLLPFTSTAAPLTIAVHGSRNDVAALVMNVIDPIENVSARHAPVRPSIVPLVSTWLLSDPPPLPPPLPPWLAAERLGDEDGEAGELVSGPLQATAVNETAAIRNERRTNDDVRRVCIAL